MVATRSKGDLFCQIIPLLYPDGKFTSCNQIQLERVFKMAKFVECTLALSRLSEKVFVNLDTVASMRNGNQGTLIILTGLPDNTLLVSETPEEILAQ